jgi:hypothetical protein
MDDPAGSDWLSELENRIEQIRIELANLRERIRPARSADPEGGDGR